MTLVETLEARRDALVDEATLALDQARLRHYGKVGAEVARERVGALLDSVMASVRDGSPVAAVQHADTVARDRFTSGFGIEEIQVAFNLLEEAMWRLLVSQGSGQSLAVDLGLIGSVMGAAKDQLARTYVELASKRHVPRIDIDAIQQ